LNTSHRVKATMKTLFVPCLIILFEDV